MFRRLGGLLAVAGGWSLAIIVCVLLGQLLQQIFAIATAAPESSLKLAEQPRDAFMVLDFDAGVIQFVRVEGEPTGEMTPMFRITRDDLRGVPVIWEQPMPDDDRALLLRDVGTGQLHPATGIWCLSCLNGVSRQTVGDRVVIDAEFDTETP